MKRIILLMLAYTIAVGGLLFAQVSLSTAIETTVILAKGDTGENSREPTTAASLGFELIGAVQSASGQLGAKGGFSGMADFPWAYAWWQPVDLLLVKMGNVFRDSTWAGPDITDWALNSNNFKVRPEFGNGIDSNGYAGGILPSAHGFYKGFPSENVSRLQVSLYPIKGLSANFGFEMLDSSNREYTVKQNYLENINVQAGYEIEGIGEAALTFVNAPDGIDPLDNVRNLYLQWKMPLNEIMNLEAGFNYKFHVSEDILYPLVFGIGFGFGSYEHDDQLIVNARLGLSLPLDLIDPYVFGVDVVASYDFESFRAYLAAGIAAVIPNEGETLFGWSVNPYITKNFGGPFFYAGFMIYNGRGSTYSMDAQYKNQINWAIPIGIRWES